MTGRIEEPATVEPVGQSSFALEATRQAGDLAALRRMLQISRGQFSLAFAVCTHRRLRDELIQDLRLAIDEQSFGPEHPEVATDLNNLAQLLQDTHRLAEAEPLMRRALAIHKHSFGAEHPNVAVSLNSLAQLLQDTGRIEEAEPMMRRALSILEESYGPDHPLVASGLNNLALMLRETKHLDKAEPLMRKMIAIFVEFTRRNCHPHPHLEAAFGNYSALLRELGQSEEQIDATLRDLRAPVSDRNHGGDD